MKHGVYCITFCQQLRYEVYVWIGERKFGYIGTYRSEAEAIKVFNEEA